MVEGHKAWLVDLDGTLYSPTPLKLAMAAELLLFGLPALGKIRAFREEHEEIREQEIDCLGDPFATQLHRTAKRLDCDANVLDKLVREWMVKRPCRWLPRLRNRGLLAEISNYRQLGGKTALVSDYPARAKLKALGASDLFDVVVANGEADGPTQLKPSPVGFLAAAEGLGVAPEDCLVIGDRDDADGEAARRAGMAFRKV
ncbi:MAG: FMN phosphatase YigB (HAD superfamily) [Planctomycetota bacterium]|jgi:FMN phosphatase YigB (HAD superfamily)